MTETRDVHPDTELLEALEEFLARTRVPTVEDIAGSAEEDPADPD